MENLSQKIYFLKNEFVPALYQISPDTTALFGKMNPTQMVEHMAAYIRLAYGNPQITSSPYTEDVVAKMQAFLKTEKPFKPNTPNPLMSDEPTKVYSENFETAIKDVKIAIDEFFYFFEQHPDATIYNPFFGSLGFELNVQLLYKHSRHHLSQFNALK